MDELFSATLNHKLRLSGGNVRKFLTAAIEGVDLGDQAEVVDKLFAALDKIEGSSGPATTSNDAAMQALAKETEVHENHVPAVIDPQLRPFLFMQTQCLTLLSGAASLSHKI